jgi:hypothetical protein
MSSYGLSANPVIEQVSLTAATEATWTGPTTTISKITIGILNDGTAFRVAFVANGTTGSTYMTVPIGGSVTFEGINWSSPIVYLYTVGNSTAYIAYWR